MKFVSFNIGFLRLIKRYTWLQTNGWFEDFQRLDLNEHKAIEGAEGKHFFKRRILIELLRFQVKRKIYLLSKKLKKNY